MAGLDQPGRIVAQDVENPECQGRSAQESGQLAMDPAQQRHDALELPAVAHVRGPQRPALDQIEDQDARLGMQHGRRDAGGMGGPARGQFVPAHDVVHGDVVADAHEAAARPVVHDEVGIGDAAADRLGCNGPAPDRERCGPRARVHGSQPRYWTRPRAATLNARSTRLPRTP